MRDPDPHPLQGSPRLSRRSLPGEVVYQRTELSPTTGSKLSDLAARSNLSVTALARIAVRRLIDREAA